MINTEHLTNSEERFLNVIDNRIERYIDELYSFNPFSDKDIIDAKITALKDLKRELFLQ